MRTRRLAFLLASTLAVVAMFSAQAQPDDELLALDQRINELSFAEKYSEAVTLRHRYLEVVAARHGTDTPEYGVALTKLSGLLRVAHRLTEAEPVWRRAFGIAESWPDDPRLIDLLMALSWGMIGDRPPEAQRLLRRALAIAEMSFGLDHPNVARPLLDLAVSLDDRKEAETLMRRALAIEEKHFGPDHPNVAERLNTLAILLRKTNRHAEAEALLRRAFDIDEKGSSEVNVTVTLANLVWVLQQKDRFADAEPLIRRALAFQEKHLGPDHPEIAPRLNMLSQVLRAGNRLAEAELVLRRAVAIHDKEGDKAVTPQAVHNLVRLLRDTNRHAEAAELLRSWSRR